MSLLERLAYIYEKNRFNVKPGSAKVAGNGIRLHLPRSWCHKLPPGTYICGFATVLIKWGSEELEQLLITSLSPW